MIPKTWEFALLALAAYRATRLLGWDAFPPIEIAREWLLKTSDERRCAACKAGRDDYEWSPDTQAWIGLQQCPHCQSFIAPEWVTTHGRRLLGELFDCAFCLGWWVALGFYLAWVVAPTAALAISAPLAISAIVGLLAKNLDA